MQKEKGKKKRVGCRENLLILREGGYLKRMWGPSKVVSGLVEKMATN